MAKPSNQGKTPGKLNDWIVRPGVSQPGNPVVTMADQGDNGLGAALQNAALYGDQLFGQPAPATYDDGSGGGGGGGGGTYAAMEAPPAPRLADSPEWLAFLNQLGLNEAQYRGDIQKRQGMAGQVAQGQIGDVGFQGDAARRQITGGLEQRGMARSGQLVRALAQQRAGEGRQVGNIQTGLANTMSGLESELMNKLIDLNTQRQQTELQMRAGGYV